MMIKSHSLVTILAAVFLAWGCSQDAEKTQANTSGAADQPGGGQAFVQDDVSQKDILHVAMGSADHSTLVKAVQAAGLENTLANAGPFTVFAPTNAAFDKLPAGTVESLLKPEKADQLTTVLYHHVLTSALDKDAFTNGQQVKMFDGTPVTMSIEGDTWKIDGAKIVASVRASNGWVHVVDAVVLPPQ
ncbi:MAG: fasciclin domain-containing protein [Candidatus Kapaibacterium sp.]|nr:MAG: fasciclin domain-containing protein [Candidatus Kapabacteria bacterium]